MTDPTKKEDKIIAIYGRVSTAKQEEDGTIETQLMEVRDFAHKAGYTIAQEYADDGWSGDVLARPALDTLRQEARLKIWEAVLIYDPDRLARRYSYQELVMDELREAGIEIIFVTIPAPKNDDEKILYGVRGLFAEYERAKIRERFRLGKLRSIKEGNILASRPLYGYDRTLREGKVPGKYIVNETEAAIVRKIFGWVANDGLTIRQVVRRLQKEGIMPKRSKRGVWSTSTLTTMLRNEAYVGRAHWYSSISVEPKNPLNKEKYRKIKKSSTKRRPKEEWMIIPVPAILDEALFDKARTRLAEHAALNPRNKKYEYLLGGRVYCSCSQRRIGAGRQRGKYLYYDCCDKILSFPLPPKCKERPVNARIADKLVWNKISGLMSSPELLRDQVERWLNKQRREVKSSLADVPALEKELAKLKEQEDRYSRAYGSGLFSIEKLKEYVEPLREKAMILESQRATAVQQARRMDTMLAPTQSEIDAFVRFASETLRDLSFEQKRAIVLGTVEKVVGTQKQLQVSGFIPVSTTNGWYKTKDRHCRSTERGEIHAF